LQDIRPGVFIRAQGQSNGDSFTSTQIRVLGSNLTVTLVGKVSQVSPSQDTLHLDPPVQGFSVIYLTTDASIVNAGAKPASLQDIRTGATVVVVGISDAPGSLVADSLRLVAATPSP
jgi:hypothetical protein